MDSHNVFGSRDWLDRVYHTNPPEENKALELWKRLFEKVKNPYERWSLGDWRCIFCQSEKREPHASDCIWIEAKKLVEESKE
jgi:hypothetical protein